MAPLDRRCGGLLAVAILAASAPLLALSGQAPPEVEFIGGAPKLMIYPGGGGIDANESWVALIFGKIEELDGQGNRVLGRTIRSLASERGIIWTRENTSIGGARAVVTRMELLLSEKFPKVCRGGTDGDHVAHHDRDDHAVQDGREDHDGHGDHAEHADHDERDDHAARGDHDDHDGRANHDGHDDDDDDRVHHDNGGHEGRDDHDHHGDHRDDHVGRDDNDVNDTHSDNDARDGNDTRDGRHDHDGRDDHGEHEDQDKPDEGHDKGDVDEDRDHDDGDDSGGSRRRRSRLLSSEMESVGSNASAASIAVEAFVFEDDAAVDYGDFSMPVLRGQIKFNIEVVAWPFCGGDHKLQVELGVQAPGDAPPKEVRDQAEERATDRKRRTPRRRAVRQAAGELDIDLDFPEVVLADNSSEACEVRVVSGQAGTSVVFTFPQFENSMLYDPTLGFVDAGEATTTPRSTTGTIVAPKETLDEPIAEVGASTVARTTDAAPGKSTTEMFASSTDILLAVVGASTASPSAGATVISGGLTMSVEDPAGFCASGQVLTGLKQAIARAAGQDNGSVELSCAVAGARRLLAARRLAGDVKVAYEISVPGGAEVAVSSLEQVTAEEMASIVNEELANAGAGVTVRVTEISSGAAPRTTISETETASSLAPSRAVDLTVSLGLLACAHGAWAT